MVSFYEGIKSMAIMARPQKTLVNGHTTELWQFKNADGALNVEEKEALRV